MFRATGDAKVTSPESTTKDEGCLPGSKATVSICNNNERESDLSDEGSALMEWMILRG